MFREAKLEQTLLGWDVFYLRLYLMNGEATWICSVSWKVIKLDVILLWIDESQLILDEPYMFPLWRGGRFDELEAGANEHFANEKICTLEPLHSRQDERQLLMKGQQKHAVAKTMERSHFPASLMVWEVTHVTGKTPTEKAKWRADMRYELDKFYPAHRNRAIGERHPSYAEIRSYSLEDSG
ncbi:hypothetical protein KIN20_016404 [Parelaphostrongylus tenuis]|uniref:Uncharacterized protein n=1 Tax=Parelaphostrongylus tenuis TaxID=148309 RepID=A0AAD5N587_PARTN|nr:hypothetical protein KIN20_016404 [Parelaphostrongylus tenuis]